MIFPGWTFCINGEIKRGEIKYGKIKLIMEKYHNLSVG